MSDIPAPPGPPPARWRSATALELVAYMAAALLAVRGCWGKTVGSGGDIFGTLWYQEWIDHCVRAGVSPNWTPWLYHPEGMDLFAHNGGNYVDMLIGLPFYWLLGSPGHMAPVTVLILVGNAVAMRTLLRSLVQSRLAILAACLVFELHPFMLAELNGGRPTQALLWFWPLALHHLLAMRDDRRWRRPILAGGFVALQALVYWFTGHMFLLAFGPLLVIFGLRQAKDWWLRLGLAAGITLLVVAPFVVSIWPHNSAGWLTTARQDAEHSVSWPSRDPPWPSRGGARRIRSGRSRTLRCRVSSASTTRIVSGLPSRWWGVWLWPRPSTPGSGLACAPSRSLPRSCWAWRRSGTPATCWARCPYPSPSMWMRSSPSPVSCWTCLCSAPTTP
jgi:hypothetical protein